MRFATFALVAGIVLLARQEAAAHPLAPSVLSFEQHAGGTVTMRWRAPATRPTGQSLRPLVPETCETLGASTIEKTEDESAVIETTELRCEPPDMLGAVVRVDGFADSSVNVVVRIARADGYVHHAILDSGTPGLTLVTK
ncbi:MAG: hypothetical protein ACN4G0_07630 [Polyangiales bacterium]